MLVFAAYTPHPPTLAPHNDSSRTRKTPKTEAAFSELAQKLYAAQPELILLLSPHGHGSRDQFSVNAHQNFETNFEDLGHFASKRIFDGLPYFAAEIKEHISQFYPVRLISDKMLDYSISIPLHLLTEELQDISVVPIIQCDRDFESHYIFGQHLYHIILQSKKRIAVIASGNLSHALTPKGKQLSDVHSYRQFDTQILDALKAQNYDSIRQIPEQEADSVQSDGIRTLTILLGLCAQIQHKAHILSYEYPHGIGYLTAVFELR